MIKGITVKSDEHENFFKRSILLFLSNGYKVSAIYGTGAYSQTINKDRHGKTGLLPTEQYMTTPEASTVEVAIIDPKGDFVPFKEHNEDVRGNTDFETLLKIAVWADGLPYTA